ncbi:hypothetical protein GOBAR_DD10231 [Gossypium barbadense]|nr:hypothetical protein GOBAR_DD10231 [Gossypium barbadense]
MAENAEVDERVDLDDNYMEEEDDDVEEHVDEDGVDSGGDENGEENDEEEFEDSKSGVDGKDQSLEVEKSHIETEHVEDEEKPTASISKEEKEKHAQLLALPPNGSEVFIGGLPKDTSEEDLRELCEAIGEIFEIRLIKDKESGESKGYAFVAFKTKEVAEKAVDELHSKEFRGKTIRCSFSETKNRLFIGNIPKSLTEDDFRKAIESVGPGVENIELIKDPLNVNRNRGFAFVLYYNNACADYSRQKMASANFKLDGNNPTVTWADPKSSPDHSAASQVKALYVKNIPDNTSTEKLKEVFQRHGEVTKVVMPPGKAGKRDFGFIHYAERSSALKAVKDTEKYEIDGFALHSRKQKLGFAFNSKGYIQAPLRTPCLKSIPCKNRTYRLSQKKEMLNLSGAFLLEHVKTLFQLIQLKAPLSPYLQGLDISVIDGILQSLGGFR